MNELLIQSALPDTTPPIHFEKRERYGGVQIVVLFPNGYGASIIKHSFSYGGRQGKWELAVVNGTKDAWHLDYSTPITNDVMGYLSEEYVLSTLNEIQQLS